MTRDNAMMTIIEVRTKEGKLCDLWFDEPQNAIKAALTENGPYKEIRLASNPMGYDFGNLDEFLANHHS
jgi:hypothetical protein